MISFLKWDRMNGIIHIFHIEAYQYKLSIVFHFGSVEKNLNSNYIIPENEHLLIVEQIAGIILYLLIKAPNFAQMCTTIHVSKKVWYTPEISCWITGNSHIGPSKFPKSTKKLGSLCRKSILFYSRFYFHKIDIINHIFSASIFLFF